MAPPVDSPPPARPAARSPETRQALAAAAYVFPFSVILWLYERAEPDQFLRYHATQGLVVNVLSAIAFAIPIALAWAVGHHPDAQWPLQFQIGVGLGISLVVLFLFGLYCYCIVQAYAGRYTVLPGITSLTYAWLGKREG